MEIFLICFDVYDITIVWNLNLTKPYKTDLVIEVYTHLYIIVWI